MRTLVRMVAWVIPLLLIVAGFALAGDRSARGRRAAPVYDPVVISTLRADFTVDRDGLMQADETITGEFPSGRHGIFRFWDVANPNDSHVRQVPEVAEITLDGLAGALSRCCGRTATGSGSPRSVTRTAI